MSTTSNGPSGLTHAIVDTLTFLGALDWMDRLSLPVDDSLTEQKARLILHDYLNQTEGDRRREPAPWADQDTTTAALKDDLRNRQVLKQLFAQAENYVKELPKPFQDALGLVSEGKQLSAYMDELSTSQCVLLFAGEMGAGKSSLINLLLGLELLPTSDLRCTAAIVEISYGPKPLAKVHWRDDSSGRSKESIVLKCESADQSADFLSQLERHIVQRDDETDESPFEKIELHWPLDMLKGGVVIVDSPGVGGSRGLPQHLCDYMERAFGFIYVIDSTASVHKHRLGQLLMKAVEANDGFEPSTTLFVCNKWDHVPDNESEKKKISEKLSMIMENIKPHHLYPISVTQSKQEILYGQVSSKHRHLIEGIRKLLPQSMKGKLKFYYRHLSAVMKRSLYSLRMSHNLHRQKMDTIKRDQTAIEARMRKLQRDASECMEKMKNEIWGVAWSKGPEVVKHLDSMKTKYRLMSWAERECPSREKNWQVNLKSANMAIAARVARELNEWEAKIGLTKAMQDKVFKFVQEEFTPLDTEMVTIAALLSFDPESGEMSHGENAGRGFTQTVKKTLDPKKTGKPNGEFMSLGAMVTNSLTLDPKEHPCLKDLFSKKQYGSDPSKVMSEATEIYLNLFTNANIVASITKYFERFSKGIDRVGSFIPKMMKADQDLLRELERDLESGEQKLVIYPRMSSKCAAIQGKLDMFYATKLFVPTFSVDQLKYGPSDKVGGGSFANVYQAVLKTRTGNVRVAVKDPIDPLRENDVTDVLLEETMLSELKHENIVQYYGVCRNGPDNNIRLIMVMEFCPFTLKSERIDKGANAPSNLGSEGRQESIEINLNYLVQICMGLKFLHSKAVVHRDLKPANVLLTAGRIVRIADLGLAKKVKFAATHGIGTPVYMAPEILCNFNKYDTKADIFSLGMIMWELWYGQDLADYAREEISGNFKTEIERGWRPTLTRRHPPDDQWKTMMTQCWDFDPEKRPTAEAVRISLAKLYTQIRRTSQIGSSTASGASTTSSTKM